MHKICIHLYTKRTISSRANVYICFENVLFEREQIYAFGYPFSTRYIKRNPIYFMAYKTTATLSPNIYAFTRLDGLQFVCSTADNNVNYSTYSWCMGWVQTFENWYNFYTLTICKKALLLLFSSTVNLFDIESNDDLKLQGKLLHFNMKVKILYEKYLQLGFFLLFLYL